MPSKNRIKQYNKDSYYHIYNRGTEKRSIFLDQQDYSIFLSYLKEYLTPKDIESLNIVLQSIRTTSAEKEAAKRKLKMNNFTSDITLLAYCLMPNHFHFLIKQKDAGSMDKFMNSLGTRYTMYFNKKYKRVGSLYQGVYKAAMVYTDEQLLNLSRYIHKQALSLPSLSGSDQPSSYNIYIGKQKTEWVNPEEILQFFSKRFPKLSYKNFTSAEDDLDVIYTYTLENH